MSCKKIHIQQTASRLPQFVAAFTVNLIGFASGFSTGWPATAIPYLEGPLSPIPLTAEESSWIVSILCLAACFVGPFIGFLPDRIGRKKTGYIVALSYITSWLLITFAVNTAMLYVARIFGGITSVGFFIFSPMYMVEIAEIRVRGILGTFAVVFCNLGIAISYVIGSYLTFLQVCYVSIALPIIFIMLFVWLPESPTYLVQSGKFDEAKRSLQWLRGNSYEITAEFDRLKTSVEKKQSSVITLSFIREIFASKATKRGLFIALILALNSVLNGIYPLLTYTVTIFQESGSELSPKISTIIVGFLLVSGNIFSSNLVEHAGRKILLIVSNCGMATSLISIGIYFYLKDTGVDVSSIGWLPVTSLSTYMVTLAIGVSPLFYAVTTEIVPLELRQMTITACVSFTWLFSFLGAKFFNNLVALVGIYSTFWMFAASCIICLLIIVFQMPETKGKSLEEIRSLLEDRKPDSSP